MTQLPMEPGPLIDLLEANRRDQRDWLRTQVREPAARAIAIERLDRLVNFEMELVEVMNEHAISLATTAASDLGWFGVDAVVQALGAHGQAVTQADYNRVRDDALRTFDGVYDGVFNQTPAFIRERQTLVRRADALWRSIQRQAQPAAANSEPRTRGGEASPRGRGKGWVGSSPRTSSALPGRSSARAPPETPATRIAVPAPTAATPPRRARRATTRPPRPPAPAAAAAAAASTPTPPAVATLARSAASPRGPPTPRAARAWGMATPSTATGGTTGRTAGSSARMRPRASLGVPKEWPPVYILLMML